MDKMLPRTLEGCSSGFRRDKSLRPRKEGDGSLVRRDRRTDEKLFGFCFFLRVHLFTLRERGRVGEREGEKQQCVAASHTPPTRDLACNPGMCPARESNL